MACTGPVKIYWEKEIKSLFLLKGSCIVVYPASLGSPATLPTGFVAHNR
jgi:hypothetical protein